MTGSTVRVRGSLTTLLGAVLLVLATTAPVLASAPTVQASERVGGAWSDGTGVETTGAGHGHGHGGGGGIGVLLASHDCERVADGNGTTYRCTVDGEAVVVDVDSFRTGGGFDVENPFVNAYQSGRMTLQADDGECPTVQGVDTERVAAGSAPDSLDENGDGWICLHSGDDGGRAWTDTGGDDVPTDATGQQEGQAGEDGVTPDPSGNEHEVCEKCGSEEGPPISYSVSDDGDEPTADDGDDQAEDHNDEQAADDGGEQTTDDGDEQTADGNDAGKSEDGTAGDGDPERQDENREDPFLTSRTVEVSGSGDFSGLLDFSDVPNGTEFTAEIGDQDDADVDGLAVTGGPANGDDGNDDTDQTLPQKDFKTADDGLDWQTELGPKPADGFDQRLENQPGDAGDGRDVSIDPDAGSGDLEFGDDALEPDAPEGPIEGDSGPSGPDIEDDTLDDFKDPDKGWETPDSGEDATGTQSGAENQPQKDFETEDDLDDDLGTKIGPNPADGYEDGTVSTGGAADDWADDGDDSDDSSGTQAPDGRQQRNADEIPPQKDFKTAGDGLDWQTELGPMPTDGFDQRLEHQPHEDVSPEDTDESKDDEDCADK